MVAEVAAIGDDNMVKEVDSHQLTCLRDRNGQLVIHLAWRQTS